jgi:hypothetical protein
MLDIENEQELSVAQKAVAEFRKTQVRHVGLYAKRLDFPCEQTTRERAFADRWTMDNTRSCVVPYLDSLLDRKATPTEAVQAATLIQWLGSHVGWCFLCECIKAAGYSEPRKMNPGGDNTSQSARCQIQSTGWRCTRGAGHEGPCAGAV